MYLNLISFNAFVLNTMCLNVWIKNVFGMMVGAYKGGEGYENIQSIFEYLVS